MEGVYLARCGSKVIGIGTVSMFCLGGDHTWNKARICFVVSWSSRYLLFPLNLNSGYILVTDVGL